jgi:hypothetical protein
MIGGTLNKKFNDHTLFISTRERQRNWPQEPRRPLSLDLEAQLG